MKTRVFETPFSGKLGEYKRQTQRTGEAGGQTHAGAGSVGRKQLAGGVAQRPHAGAGEGGLAAPQKALGCATCGGCRRRSLSHCPLPLSRRQGTHCPGLTAIEPWDAAEREGHLEFKRRRATGALTEGPPCVTVTRPQRVGLLCPHLQEAVARSPSATAHAGWWGAQAGPRVGGA